MFNGQLAYKNPVKRYEELRIRIESFIDDESKDNFNDLILETHSFQKSKCQLIRNYAATYCANPKSWQEVAPIPTEAFKSTNLISFPETRISKTFLTSGTTGDTRGKHHFIDTSIYEKSILTSWKNLNLPNLPIVCLSQSPAINCQSSLIHMFGTLNGKFLIGSSGQIDTVKINSFLKNNRRPFILTGTALAFLYLMEELSGIQLELPKGSWIMETGGYKGSNRRISKKDFYSMIRNNFNLPEERIINEYSMTELSSQFYSRGLNSTHKSTHWLKARVLKPGTKSEVEDGERGILSIYDLANLGSSIGIMTGDIAIKRGSEFELIGRNENLEPRGCSRTAETYLSSHN